MQGLRTTSVLILDDDDDHALRIQKSLAQHGIGAILVPGGVGELQPEEPLRGVRVAVLDIDLGFGTSSEQKVQYTGGLVDQLIDPQNGPYVAVVWTGNAEDFALFRTELDGIRCPPVATVILDKSEVLELDPPRAQAEAILTRIDQALEDAPPLEFSNLWEQIVRDAATDTVVSLRLDQPPESPNARAESFLAQLLNSEADSRALEDDSAALRALLAALNPVHFDKVEEQSIRVTESEARVVTPIREAASDPAIALTASERTALNTALLFDRRAVGFGPGRVYRFGDVAALLDGPALPDALGIRVSSAERDHRERAEQLPLVLLEVSAACDHQQGHVDTARLIAGVAFPASTMGSDAGANRVSPRGRALYLRAVETVRMPEVEGFPEDDVVVVWNARYPLSISAEALSQIEPIGRFREPLLTDIRAWLGYQAGRPGYVSV